MLRSLEIIWTSFKMALTELRVNKLRTFLSLFGVTIGIFCIIGVLATVNSLEANIQNEVKALGTNTIYIDKWEYSGGGPDYPWWKYIKRPVPEYEELGALKDRSVSALAAAYIISSNYNVEYEDNFIQNVNYYGVTEEFNKIQNIDAGLGRYLNSSEFEYGSPSVAMGYSVAETLFGSADKALGQTIRLRGRKAQVVGIIKKQGKSMIGGWDYDQSIILPYRYMRQMVDEKNASPLIMVQGKQGVPTISLKEELRGALRQVRRLSPRTEDNFSLNDVGMFSEMVSQLFGSVNAGGWAIAALSLLVGMFGVANIMFVTVRERTSQIGLKKAIGAKRSTILTEFLLESAFLCIIGGAIGLLLVFLLTKLLSGVFDFPIFISLSNMSLAIVICVVVGVLAGIFPAWKAANLDPVVAIRTK